MKTLLIILAIIIVLFLLTRKVEPFIEGLTNDEAVQNVASLYNSQDMTVTNMNVTGTSTNNILNVTNAATIPKLQLGTKWLLTGAGKDTSGTDDEWLRLLDSKGAYYGGIAATKFYDTSIGNIADNIRNLQNQINSLQAQINQRVVIGGRYGFHRGHDNSVIWGHGITLMPCGWNGTNNCTAG